jgi:hexulose-6-phosphate isomerase
MNRRTFLKTNATAAAALTLVPASHAAAKRDLRKAIMYSTIGVKGSVLDKFKAMKAAGFEGVEPLGAMNRDEVIAALKETGLEAASVCDHIHWVKPLSAPDEATRQQGYDGADPKLAGRACLWSNERAARAGNRGWKWARGFDV